MQFHAALVKEQSVTFAVVAVRPSVLAIARREKLRHELAAVWKGIPVVLMSQDASGTPTYQGRPDLVRFCANVPMATLPWKRWALT